MQHNGLPTRLLDWSDNPLTGLYFAVNSDPEESGVLWALVPHILNEVMIGEKSLVLPNHPKVREVIKVAFNGEGNAEQVLAVWPSESDLKLLLQAGRFTIHGSREPLAARNGADKYITRWVVPKESKATLRAQLDLMAVSASTLFPDLESLAADVRDRYAPRVTSDDRDSGPPQPATDGVSDSAPPDGAG